MLPLPVFFYRNFFQGSFRDREFEGYPLRISKYYFTL
jgi:hypothetical protein